MLMFGSERVIDELTTQHSQRRSDVKSDLSPGRRSLHRTAFQQRHWESSMIHSRFAGSTRLVIHCQAFLVLNPIDLRLCQGPCVPRRARVNADSRRPQFHRLGPIALAGGSRIGRNRPGAFSSFCTGAMQAATRAACGQLMRPVLRKTRRNRRHTALTFSERLTN